MSKDSANATQPSAGNRDNVTSPSSSGVIGPDEGTELQRLLKSYESRSRAAYDSATKAYGLRSKCKQFGMQEAWHRAAYMLRDTMAKLGVPVPKSQDAT